MGLLSAFRPSRHVTLRVFSNGDPAKFDALVVLDRRRGFEVQNFADRETPFETELPDRDVTIVVQPRDAAHPVIAEYEVAVAGKRRLWARSWHATPVLRRHRHGIVGAGVAHRPMPDADGPAVGAPAF